ncbi:MAG: hypothetical protein CMJ75_06680 [Planctomycetaceae bacterium]|nr:hypothetical protein [Planctomycetaceae bacterium]
MQFDGPGELLHVTARAYVHCLITLRQELQSDRLPKCQVISAVHFTHGTRPETGNDAIAAQEHVARSEMPMLGGSN